MPVAPRAKMPGTWSYSNEHVIDTCLGSADPFCGSNSDITRPINRATMLHPLKASELLLLAMSNAPR